MPSISAIFACYEQQFAVLEYFYLGKERKTMLSAD